MDRKTCLKRIASARSPETAAMYIRIWATLLFGLGEDALLGKFVRQCVRHAEVLERPAHVDDVPKPAHWWRELLYQWNYITKPPKGIVEIMPWNPQRPFGQPWKEWRVNVAGPDGNMVTVYKRLWPTWDGNNDTYTTSNSEPFEQSTVEATAAR